MSERDPKETRVEAILYHNPIRAAIHEARFGDMETALAISRGELAFVDVDPTDNGPTILEEGFEE